MAGFITLRLLDLIDIILVAILLYQVYRLIKGTVAINILAGIFVVYLFWLVVKALNMEMISSILGQVMAVGVIALIIVFQQEIRRFLLILGSRYRKSSGFHPEKWFPFMVEEKPPVRIDPILEAVSNLSASLTGALIVIARESELKAVIETGDQLNAELSNRLLETIFVKNSPLHDGAVVVSGDVIVAARCVLPTTERIDLPAHFGMRHRAALGMAEKSDAIIVLVSEESGAISICNHTEIFANLSIAETRRILENEIAVVKKNNNGL